MSDPLDARLSPDERIEVLHSRISAIDSDSALLRLEGLMEASIGGFVCFANVHTVILGLQGQSFREITNSSLMSLADGKPIYWSARSRGPVGHVPGPDFMLMAIKRFKDRRHFFYGSTPEVLEALRSGLLRAIPGLNICGVLSPPFRILSQQEKHSHYQAIREAGAELVWVGLGAPKQELWMAEAHELVKPAILLGVGAAFDFHAGNVRRAPRIMRLAGLEWLYRLIQQPGRLWRRYLVTNTLFIFHVVAEIARRRLGRKV